MLTRLITVLALSAASVLAYCGPPRLEFQPVQYRMKPMLEFYPALDDTEACEDIQVRVDGVIVADWGQLRYRNGGWYISTTTIALGQHTVTAYTRTKAGTSQSTAGQGTLEVQRCPPLSITSPAMGSESTETTPTFAGEYLGDRSQGCYPVNIQIDGIVVASGDNVNSADSVPYGTWSWRTWPPLLPGDHIVSVRVTDSGLYPSESTSRSFKILAPPPQPSGDIDRTVGRRRNLCARGTVACYDEGLRGRLGHQCVADLRFNLERCGACDGPDCTTIPNVDVVSCTHGKCVVHECLEGFQVEGNECVAI